MVENHSRDWAQASWVLSTSAALPMIVLTHTHIKNTLLSLVETSPKTHSLPTAGSQPLPPSPLLQPRDVRYSQSHGHNQGPECYSTHPHENILETDPAPSTTTLDLGRQKESARAQQAQICEQRLNTGMSQLQATSRSLCENRVTGPLVRGCGPLSGTERGAWGASPSTKAGCGPRRSQGPEPVRPQASGERPALQASPTDRAQGSHPPCELALPGQRGPS